MRRVLIFSIAYHPFVGGAEIAVKEITDRIKPEDIAFDMVTLRFDSNQSKYERMGNVNIHRISSSKLLFPFSAFFSARRLHKKNNYDFIWSIMAGRAGFSALFFKFTYPNIPFLLSLQEGDELDYPKKRAGILWYVIGGLFKRIFRKADLIQAISVYLGKWARDMGYRGEIEIIPNGADLKRFVNRESGAKNHELRIKLGIKANENVIVTTSRLVEKNAIEDIIKSLSHLPDNTKLLIIGAGPMLGNLQQIANNLNLGVGQRVLFLDHINHERLPQYLHIADVFVRPSLSEGMGSSFIEAMAAGVPVVATPVGGITDFLKDRETGLFCEVRNPMSIADKVNLLLNDETLRNRIIKNAEEMTNKKYSWDLIAKNMKEKVFDKLESRKVRSILIATGLYPPDIGGPATYSKLLKDELPRHGIDVSVISFGEVRKLPKLIRHIVYFLKVWHRGRKSDVIYAQDPVSVGLPALLAAKILRKRFMLKIVGDYAWEQMQVQNYKENNYITVEEFQNRKFDFVTEIRKKIERWVAKKAEKIIVPSNYLKKIILMWGIDNKKILIIHNGYKNEEYGNRETLRALLRFNGKLIISIGRLVPWKGFDTLIEIYSHIKKKFGNVKLVIAGSGPDMRRLQNLIDNKRLSGDISLTGALQRDVLLRYIKASDIFVLNTGYEGFSHQLLEVMGVGVPIVTTNIGGNPEIIENGKDGVLVEYNNKPELEEAIIKTLSNDSHAKILAENAKRKIKEFSEDRMITDTIKVFKKV